MANTNNKSWLSPLMAVSFGVVALSGLLMLFHLRVPGMHTLHEWVGILLVITGVFHLTLNWKIFVTYFKNKNVAVGAFVAIGLVALALLVAPSQTNYAGGGGYARQSLGQGYHGGR